jgi:branched-chain amino acid transport system substrate-binding protein
MASQERDILSGRYSRREFLKVAGAAGAALGLSGGLGGILAACGSSTDTPDTTASAPSTTGAAPSTTAAATTGSTATTVSAGPAKTLRIGMVHPETGDCANFAEADSYVFDLVKKTTANGLTVGGTTYAVEIVAKDGQSNPSQAATVTQQLINEDKVDFVVTHGTPVTTNPVADTCEAAGVPVVATTVPWQAYYFGRGAKPNEPSPFKWSFCFCFGAEGLAGAYLPSWPQLPNNKVVAVMWPNDADGDAFRTALGPALKEGGYTVVDPGAYENGTNDFSAQLTQFKKEGCEIYNGAMIPSDFTTFWRQRAQQGFKPKIAETARTCLFPSQVEAMGDLGYNLAGAAFWAPVFPYKSTLTGMTSQQIGDGYEAATGKQWHMAAGSSLALFDVATSAWAASGNPTDKAAVAKAMLTLEVETPVAKLAWGKGPAANIVTTPFVNGQWVKGTGKYKFDWVCVDNAMDPAVPVAAKLLPYTS